MAELRQTFRPEFLNRIDEIIVFHQLTEENIRSIARRMLDTIGSRMAPGHHPPGGRRCRGRPGQGRLRCPLRRPSPAPHPPERGGDVVAEQMLDGKLQSGDTAHVRLRDDKVVIEK